MPVGSGVLSARRAILRAFAGLRPAETRFAVSVSSGRPPVSWRPGMSPERARLGNGPTAPQQTGYPVELVRRQWRPLGDDTGDMLGQSFGTQVAPCVDQLRVVRSSGAA